MLAIVGSTSLLSRVVGYFARLIAWILKIFTAENATFSPGASLYFVAK